MICGGKRRARKKVERFRPYARVAISLARSAHKHGIDGRYVFKHFLSLSLFYPIHPLHSLLSTWLPTTPSLPPTPPPRPRSSRPSLPLALLPVSHRRKLFDYNSTRADRFRLSTIDGSLALVSTHNGDELAGKGEVVFCTLLFYLFPS